MKRNSDDRTQRQKEYWIRRSTLMKQEYTDRKKEGNAEKRCTKIKHKIKGIREQEFKGGQ